MKVSEAGFQFIRDWEQFRPTAYWDKLGQVWTIGYGTTDGVKQGDTITRADAELRMREYVRRSEPQILKLIKPSVVIRQCEIDALAAFVYNLGIGRLAESSVLQYYNAGRKCAATAAFMQWISSDGKKQMGLVLRRRAEAAMFAGTD